MRFVSTAGRRSLLTVVVLLAAGVGAVPSVASAAGRVALVMGNSAYVEIGRLPNPANDASGVSAALARLGFDVTLLSDATRDTMHDALLAFAEESEDADVALVFYAGHGLEAADGRNYLVPVDARLADAGDLPVEAVSLATVVDAISGARVPIVILDAARNDPFVNGHQKPRQSEQMVDHNILGVWSGASSDKGKSGRRARSRRQGREPRESGGGAQRRALTPASTRGTCRSDDAPATTTSCGRHESRIRRFLAVANTFAQRGDPGTESPRASLESTGAGVLIAYATLPGDVAGDGGPGDRYSPYTEALLAHLEEPGVELEAMFRRVAAAVYAATEGEQHPAVLTTLTEPGTIRLADPHGRLEDGTDGR